MITAKKQDIRRNVHRRVWIFIFITIVSVKKILARVSTSRWIWMSCDSVKKLPAISAIDDVQLTVYSSHESYPYFFLESHGDWTIHSSRIILLFAISHHDSANSLRESILLILHAFTYVPLQTYAPSQNFDMFTVSKSIPRCELNMDKSDGYNRESGFAKSDKSSR